MRTPRLFFSSSLVLLAALTLVGVNGCGGTGGSGSSGSGLTGKGGKGGKAGSSSAGTGGSTAGTSDGGADVGGSDAGGTDAGGADAGGTDAGGTSAGGSDVGGTNAGGTDAGGSDAGGTDAGGTDAGGTDAGGTNAGGTDAGGTDAGGSSAAGSSGSGQSGNGSGGTGPNCAGDPNIDNDGDGYSEADGDCNDCDANANPGAIDIVTYNPDGTPAEQQADEDCDGTPTMPGQDTCDQDLAIEDNDPMKGAFAMDICKVSQNGSWGIVKAEYVKIDGTPLSGNGNQGHGLLPKFGNTTTPQRGARMFAVSSGTARSPGDPGYSSPGGFSQGTDSGSPPGFPLESPDCPGVKTGAPHDAVALRLTIKAPTNAKSFSFKFKFYTYEYPGYICSQYNDFFTVLMDPPPPDVNQTNKNITFDAKKNPVSVNNAFLEVCSPGNHGGKNFACPGGTADLQGTGFEGHGATLWLQTQANVEPGSTFTLMFGAFDSGDHILDSTGLVDDFQWSATPAEGGTSTGKP